MAVALDTSPLGNLDSMNHTQDIWGSTSHTVLAADTWGSLDNMSHIEDTVYMQCIWDIRSSVNMSDKFLPVDILDILDSSASYSMNRIWSKHRIWYRCTLE